MNLADLDLSQYDVSSVPQQQDTTYDDLLNELLSIAHDRSIPEENKRDVRLAIDEIIRYKIMMYKPNVIVLTRRVQAKGAIIEICLNQKETTKDLTHE